MAKVPYSVETLPKISIVWVGRTNVTDRRQTTDGRTTTYSQHELEFTFAKNKKKERQTLYEQDEYGGRGMGVSPSVAQPYVTITCAHARSIVGIRQFWNGSGAWPSIPHLQTSLRWSPWFFVLCQFFFSKVSGNGQDRWCRNDWLIDCGEHHWGEHNEATDSLR